MNAPARPLATPAALGWRLVALVYDLLPVLALWMLLGAIVLVLRGGSPVLPWTAAWWLQNLALWLLTGAYAVGSWQRGGQTLGMRPWRLRVVAADGGAPTFAALVRRYLWATLSLGLGGLGFLWSLVDPERRAWHDLASGTRLVRLPKA